MNPDSTSPVDLSVVIPSFRSRRTIGPTISSILAQETSLRMEVIVVDSSDDGTGDWIVRNFSGIVLVRSRKRLLPGAARNLGAARSRGRYLAFVDADVTCPSDWVDRMSAALDSRQAVQIVGAAVANANPQSSASRVLYWIEFSEFASGQESGVRQSLNSSNLMMRRKDFLRGDGFSEDWAMSEDQLYFASFEGAIYFAASVEVRHTQRTDWQAIRQHLRNLGVWSGRLRAMHDVRGSHLRTWPALTWGLIPYRTALVLSRSVRYGLKSERLSWADLLKVISGIVTWRKGFRRGLGQAASSRPGPTTGEPDGGSTENSSAGSS